MENTVRLSPGALLYAVLRLRKSGIHGLLDVFSALPDAEFPTCLQNAEHELLQMGCGRMNFDGDFSLSQEFADLVSACADETSVLQVDRRLQHRQQRLTCYLHAGAALVQDGGNCLLCNGVVLPGAVLEFLALPADCQNLRPAVVDAALLAEKNRAGLVAAGCTEPLADLLIAAAAGDGGYAQLVRIVNKRQTALAALAWGPAGTVGVEVDYTTGVERLRVCPLTAEEAGTQIAALTAL